MAGTTSPVRGRPPRALRSHPVKPGAQAPGVGKGTTARGKPTGAPRATGPDGARRTTRGHQARQRGGPPPTTKAHGQLASNNGRRVPQTRRARTTREEARHENRWSATSAAVLPDVCASGSKPSPCRPRNSRRLDARVRAGRVPSPCRLRNAAVQMHKCAPRIEAPHTQHHTRNTQHSTPSKHTGEQERSGRDSVVARTPRAQHNTPSEHTGAQEPGGP